MRSAEDALGNAFTSSVSTSETNFEGRNWIAESVGGSGRSWEGIQELPKQCSGAMCTPGK